MQRAHAAVAVGLERAHAEFLGQGEGLLIVNDSGLTGRKITAGCNIA
jgi:hypothetical protein